MSGDNTFRDNLGQPYEIKLNVPKIRRISDRIGIDLLNANHFLQVCRSLSDRMAVVFLACREQAESLEIDVEEFENRLIGEGIVDSAGDALLSECARIFTAYGQKSLASIANRQIETLKKARADIDRMMSTGEWDLFLDQAETEVFGGPAEPLTAVAESE